MLSGIPTESVDNVKQFLPHTDVSGVIGFLGLASYYCRFIKGFPKIAEPVYELTRKNTV